MSQILLASTSRYRAAGRRESAGRGPAPSRGDRDRLGPGGRDRRPGAGQTRHGSLAIEQLRASSGREVVFHTALAVVRGDRVLQHVDRTVVRFRVLTDTDIGSYIQREQPLDCAGSFKCEGLGIGLFESIRNEDPTALIGLPLIAVARLLRECEGI
jgi:hypothetical protein